MDMSISDPVRDELLKTNPTFRDLVNRHQSYEERLAQLSGLTYPSEDEQLEESTLKKKKLMVKDEIYAMMHDYQTSH
ncbi:YdcH family protein [Leptolyngbya sp. 7M]|uniref:YdcH family protein n=1 Tax=Leptolyngbya sp. 7M TaxID=2812896 RepID=UPI001B8B0E7B|nr:YdcH family protein [Leptolyngbya sp. 7M]QYO66736.1 YdcH family protein [Leptolyngbya sp. 7M]